MFVSKFLNSLKVKNVPIELILDTKQNIKKIRGLCDYNQFKKINWSTILQLQKKNMNMPLIAIDTSKQAILDVDKIEIFKQFYPKIYKKLNKE